MMTNEKDRRIRRTRHLLHEALLALIQEKPYQAITVQDVLDRADVGRSTFYAHFRDKDDLFEYGLDRMLDALSEHMNAYQDPASPTFPSLELFRHVQKHHYLYQALMRGQGIELLLKRGRAALTQRIEAHLQTQIPAPENTPVPIPVLACFLSGALITLLQWWLDNQMPYPPERMDEIYRQLAFPGVLEALGINNKHRL